jgi:crotonobetainyl-CoA:carnitine CoA-transferase CaiB-like acyl-CoA transferase
VEARRLHVSLLHSATAALGNVAQSVMVSGNDAVRWGNAHPNLCPYQLFPVAAGSIVIAVGTDAQWIACVQAIGLGDLADDPALKTNAGRVVERARVVAAFTERLLTRDADHWLSLLLAAGVPCGAVKTVRQALAAIEASPSGGVHPLPPAAIRFQPPLLDEHGALIRERGWEAFDR